MTQSTQVDLTGGESVYCINTFQMEKAVELHGQDSESGERLRSTVDHIERKLSRNEQAALAMILLDRLRVGPAA